MDRDLALRRVEDWAGGGTYPVQVVYGPEGCGKSAWLRQSVELLREPMWNMTEDGFKQLYEQLPGSKPEFEEVWRLTGGNPAMLERLIIERRTFHNVSSESGQVILRRPLRT